MISPEAAKAAVEAAQRNESKAAILARLDALPEHLARIGRGLADGLGRYGAPSPDPYFAALEELPEPERNQLFEAMMPGFGKDVSNAWDACHTRPLGLGGCAAPFRAPSNAALYRNPRRGWFRLTFHFVRDYNRDLVWLAEWCGHLPEWFANGSLPLLFATAIQQPGERGERMYRTLVDTVLGKHDVATINRVAVETLLMLDRPEGWEAVERLLLTAQRQEGLRATILDALDGACPEALLRLIRLIESERLYRFAAVSARFMTWFRLAPGEANESAARRWMSSIIRAMESPDARRDALVGDQPSAAFFALWMEACIDLDNAVPQALALQSRPEAEWRFVAVWFLGLVVTADVTGSLARFLGDSDLRVAALAWKYLCERNYQFANWDGPEAERQQVFRAASAFVRQLPSRLTLADCVWGETGRELDRKECANQLARFWIKLPFADIQPFLEWMSTEGRCAVLQQLEARLPDHPLHPEERQFVLDAAGDAGSLARDFAHRILQQAKLERGDAAVLEALLKGRRSSTRQAILTVLLTQEDDALRDSIARLKGSSNAAQQAAAVELERALLQRSPITPAGVAASLATDAEPALPPIPADPARTAGIAPALSPSAMAALVAPEACQELRAALYTLVNGHAEREVTYEVHQETRTGLLGNLTHEFPAPLHGVPFAKQRERLPLAELWESFWSDWVARHPDAPRAVLLMENLLFGSFDAEPDNETASGEASAGDRVLRHFLIQLPDWDWRTNQTAHQLLPWLRRMTPPTTSAALLAQFCEATVQGCLTELPTLAGFLQQEPAKGQWFDPRSEFLGRFSTWFIKAAEDLAVFPEAWPDALLERVWRLARTLEVALPPVALKLQYANVDSGFQPPFLIAAAAHSRGFATEDDLIALLRHNGGDNAGLQTGFASRAALSTFTQEPPRDIRTRYPGVAAVVDRFREELLDAELARGDLNTATSSLCLQLRCVWGTRRTLRILAALGKEKLTRGYLFGIDRGSVLSHLLRVSRPLPSDTAETARQAAATLGIKASRLRDLAVYAPQWSRLIEEILEEPGLEDACWWLHAHTKDTQWSLPEELKQEWGASVRERTPLTPVRLTQGAVDTEWFQRIIVRLGKDRWKALLESAKYASGGAGHKRAELFGNALLGEASLDSIEDRIRSSRSQDHVRALGLVPLPAQRGAARAELVRRYRLFQEFSRQTKQFGSQKQASEKLAVEVALENLARTAGHSDPRRFAWAMEAERMQDIKEGSIVLPVNGVTLTLQLGADGKPDLLAERDGKPLKEIPAAARKLPQVAELRSREKELLLQLRQMRNSLERSMVDGDVFSPDDWRELRTHPLLSRLFDSIVWRTETGRLLAPEQVGTEAVRAAHPLDLLESGEWPRWQRWCLEQERKQPFKQTFREVYTLTAMEREARWSSSRYAGHEIHPRQGAALLGRRGWITDADEGMRITFYRQQITAHLSFVEGAFTPLELDGLTVQDLYFTPAGEWQRLPLEEVPPRLFSEVMRDVDLLVSVAHRGNVDPEASQSTTEMRAALVTETARLMKLTNLRIQGSHIFVNGTLGDFNIHLGSGVVHRHPGGALCILPASSQHRGRLFLPFADDDPKTAEIVSKAVLLAKDHEIQDPTVLAQIRAAV